MTNVAAQPLGYLPHGEEEEETPLSRSVTPHQREPEPLRDQAVEEAKEEDEPVTSKLNYPLSNEYNVNCEPIEQESSEKTQRISTASSSGVTVTLQATMETGEKNANSTKESVYIQVQQPMSAVRRRSSGTAKQPTVSAPSVWISPDWATYPIIENFYGHARKKRVNSFYEVMCSPTNVMKTTTLAENCCSYVDVDGVDTPPASRGKDGVTYRMDSFAYSCSTDNSEGVNGFRGHRSSFDATPRIDSAGMNVDAIQKKRRVSSMERAGVTNSNNTLPVGASGYVAWHRIRQNVTDGQDIVPIPNSYGNSNGHFMKNAMHGMENPQGGGGMELSPSGSHSDLESPTAFVPPTTARLRLKLLESVRQLDECIRVERDFAWKAKRNIKKIAKVPAGNVVWNLLCGARTTEAAQFDGVAFLHDQLSVAVHNRALNQLQRHRRHVNGILQIVTSHNPDLELTEKQLDSFESADAMLGNDIKYSVLKKQVEMMRSSVSRRKAALADAKMKNGSDCFELPRIKSAMLANLLEAVSWYRLVQMNSREESASSSVVAPPSNSSVEESIHGASSGSRLSASRSLQELQVEKILDVLAGAEFYSDYNELMCQPDWWEIAQAHFENLIFSKSESRICQWMYRLSKDVAGACEESLEEERQRRDATSAHIRDGMGSGDRRRSISDGLGHRQAEWTIDPQPEHILEFIERLTRRVRREFNVPNDVSKSLNSFMQRAVFPRVAALCFNQKAVRDCQRKDKVWRKKCIELSGIPMEIVNVPADLAARIRTNLPSRRLHSSHGKRVYLIRAIEAFNGMSSIVPCDLLEELMHGVVILHHEAALVLGTTQFSVETFFPLLAYVLLHCQLPRIHAQLHLLENFAITNSNVNGEESYYVYCVHAAVEYVCNSNGLGTTMDGKQDSRPISSPTQSESTVDENTLPVDELPEKDPVHQVSTTCVG